MYILLPRPFFYHKGLFFIRIEKNRILTILIHHCLSLQVLRNGQKTDRLIRFYDHQASPQNTLTFSAHSPRLHKSGYSRKIHSPETGGKRELTELQNVDRKKGRRSEFRHKVMYYLYNNAHLHSCQGIEFHKA